MIYLALLPLAIVGIVITLACTALALFALFGLFGWTWIPLVIAIATGVYLWVPNEPR